MKISKTPSFSSQIVQMRKLLLALMIVLGTEAASETTANASNFTVSVILTDAARGGCWTNLQKVRIFTEEKLSKIGFKLGTFNLAETQDNQYVLEIFVKSNRHYLDNNSFCDGNALVDFKTNTYVNGILHSAILAEFSSSCITPVWDNTTLSLVDLVIRQIESLFDSTGR